jgi:DNA helicase-2/ATP-dependent DNA helicase PcrA
MSPLVADRLTSPYRRAAEDLRDNPGQWQAYESKGHCVILAGPGSGKTKTLTVKMARMLEEDVVAPRGIACITYNTECVRELRQRLERLGIQEEKRVFIGTIHSFCLRNIVRPYARLAGVQLPAEIVIASGDEREAAFQEALAEEISADEYPAAWLSRMEEYRRTHLDRGTAEWFDDLQLAALVEAYEARLREKGLVDFDDLVLVGLRLVEGHAWIRRAIRARFPILVVDEYQDLGVPLHRLVLSLCMGAGIRLLAVGDPDQSIYGFTGARPELLVELSRLENVERVVLRFNYRSGTTLVAAAAAALGEGRDYEAKGSYAGTIDVYDCPDGLEAQAERICGSVIPEALARREGRTLGDIAILYVDWNDGDVIARKVAESGMHAIRIDRGAPYAKTALTRWLEDCARWCAGGWKDGTPRLSGLIRTWIGFNRSVHDERARYQLRLELVRFLFTHRNGEQSVREWLIDLEESCLGSKLDGDLRDEREACVRLKKAFASDGILASMTVAVLGGQAGAVDHLNLVTLHSAKGLEFEVVVLMGLEQGKLPRWQATTEVGKREARRLFYVGLTRAKHEVHMTYCGWTENRYGRRFARGGPSEFLIEVQRQLRNA